MLAQSQQPAAEVEEVVANGSYIRRSAFAQHSPVATVTHTDLYESVAPSVGLNRYELQS
jgi:hypothetical protein